VATVAALVIVLGGWGLLATTAEDPLPAAPAKATVGAPENTVLRVTSEPSGAQIFVNGAFAGKTPARRLLVPRQSSGAVEVEARKAGFADTYETLSISQGARAEVHLVLLPL
jgi:hypothetical protein